MKASEKTQEYGDTNQRPSLLLHHALTEGAGGYLLLKTYPDGGMGVTKGNILTVPVNALWISACKLVLE